MLTADWIGLAWRPTLKSVRFCVIALLMLLAGCCGGIKNIDNSPDTLTDMTFTFKTDKSQPKGYAYPCLTQTHFYLSHGQFLYRTEPLTESDKPDLIASSGAYSYNKCGAGCGHISLYNTNGKDAHTIWDFKLCYQTVNRGTYVANDRGNPTVYHEGTFKVRDLSYNSK